MQHILQVNPVDITLNANFIALNILPPPGYIYSKDSITYKEHVLVFKNGLVNRKCEIYTYEVE